MYLHTASCLPEILGLTRVLKTIFGPGPGPVRSGPGFKSENNYSIFFNLVVLLASMRTTLKLFPNLFYFYVFPGTNQLKFSIISPGTHPSITATFNASAENRTAEDLTNVAILAILNVF